MEELKKFVNQLAGENGWYGDGHEQFLEAGESMLSHGIDLEEVKEILAKLYSAVAEEYGE